MFIGGNEIKEIFQIKFMAFHDKFIRQAKGRREKSLSEGAGKFNLENGEENFIFSAEKRSREDSYQIYLDTLRKFNSQWRVNAEQLDGIWENFF
jgi:hypothetical protein